MREKTLSNEKRSESKRERDEEREMKKGTRCCTVEAKAVDGIVVVVVLVAI